VVLAMTKLTTLAFQPKLSGSGMQRRLGGYQRRIIRPRNPQNFPTPPDFAGERGVDPRFSGEGIPVSRRFGQNLTGFGVPGGGGGPGISWSQAAPPRVCRASWPEHCGSYGASADSDVASAIKRRT
jgi:hypothetical protein